MCTLVVFACNSVLCAAVVSELNFYLAFANFQAEIQPCLGVILPSCVLKTNSKTDHNRECLTKFWTSNICVLWVGLRSYISLDLDSEKAVLHCA